MCYKENTSPLLVGVQSNTATMEINMTFLRKLGTDTPQGPEIPGHIPKGFSFQPQEHNKKLETA